MKWNKNNKTLQTPATTHVKWALFALFLVYLQMAMRLCLPLCVVMSDPKAMSLTILQQEQF